MAWPEPTSLAPAPPSPLLRELEAESSKGQVYGKPLTKSESSALKAAVEYWATVDADLSKPDSLRAILLSYLKVSYRFRTPLLPQDLCSDYRPAVLVDSRPCSSARGSKRSRGLWSRSSDGALSAVWLCRMLPSSRTSPSTSWKAPWCCSSSCTCRAHAQRVVGATVHTQTYTHTDIHTHNDRRSPSVLFVVLDGKSAL